MNLICWVKSAPGGGKETEGKIGPGESQDFQIGAGQVSVSLDVMDSGRVSFNPKLTWVINHGRPGYKPIPNRSPVATRVGDNVRVRPSGAALRPEDSVNNTVTSLEFDHT